MPQSALALCSDSPCLVSLIVRISLQEKIERITQVQAAAHECLCPKAPYRMNHTSFSGESLCSKLAPGTLPMGLFKAGDLELLSDTSTCKPRARCLILYAIAACSLLHRQSSAAGGIFRLFRSHRVSSVGRNRTCAMAFRQDVSFAPCPVAPSPVFSSPFSSVGPVPVLALFPCRTGVAGTINRYDQPSS
jgi:hypothetical protein